MKPRMPSVHETIVCPADGWGAGSAHPAVVLCESGCVLMRGGGSLMRMGISDVDADSGRCPPPSGSGGSTSMLDVLGTSDQPAARPRG
jgi:hypothetical protein